jgi:serine protease inhibitor
MITFKKFTVSEAKDPKEYGYEGDMAISQLKSVIMNAQELMDMLKPETDLPEWVQSKITLAEDYISTARNYMKSENE